MSTLSTERVQFENALLALLAGMDSGAGSGAGIGTVDPTRITAINYVKAKLDELIPEGEGLSFSLSSEPNVSNPLDLLINSHLDECTKDICLSAPISVLFPAAVAESDLEGTHYTDFKIGCVALPPNFLRLSSFKMADWAKDVSNPITPAHKDYKKQSTVLRGGITKPVAVLTWKSIDGTMTRILEYYSVNTSHVVEKLLYIPEQYAEDFIAVNMNLMDSLAWMTASKILQITLQFDAAKIAQERVIQSYTNL